MRWNEHDIRMSLRYHLLSYLGFWALFHFCPQQCVVGRDSRVRIFLTSLLFFCNVLDAAVCV